MKIDREELELLAKIYIWVAEDGLFETTALDNLGINKKDPVLNKLKDLGLIELPGKQNLVGITPLGIDEIKKKFKPDEAASDEAGIRKLEIASEKPGVEIDVDEMVKEYRKLYQNPIWRLAEDIQRQAMLYANIIELLKEGKNAAEIKERMESLNLMPGTKLPNPNNFPLLKMSFNKIAKYRKSLVELVKKYGVELLEELSIAFDQAVGVGVNIGFPPSISISLTHTATLTSRE